MTKPAPLKLLADHNVPKSVVEVFRSFGHDAVTVAETMPTNSSDPVVAVAAIEAGRILVSWDKDFNHQRFTKPRFAGLSRIAFACPEPTAAIRLSAIMDIVEFAAARASGTPVKIRIAPDKVVVHC